MSIASEEYWELLWSPIVDKCQCQSHLREEEEKGKEEEEEEERTLREENLI